jgi:hypothetical protein
MSTWLLTLLLSTAHAAGADDAAAVLSRYPAGMMPTSEPVMSAIETLGITGAPEDRAVLESLREMEKPSIVSAATTALAAIDRRVRRTEYTAPDSRQMRRWLSEQPKPLTRADGTVLGRNEQDALSYAALILGPPRTESLGERDLLVEAQGQEDVNDAAGALLLYAQAAALGHPTALTTIRDFGVDPELLLLGMSVSTAAVVLERAPPQALDVLVREGSTKTVSVLIERADTAGHIERAVALDALADMLRSTPLSASARRSARSELEKAATSTREAALSAFAREALVDLEW